MKEENQLTSEKEKKEWVTQYKPEDQVFQRLLICEYLKEIFEAREEDNP